MVIFFFFKQKTAYEMRISDWSSDVCSSDLLTVDWLIETHAHADHLSAAPWLQQQLGGKLMIGREIIAVQTVLGKVFNEGTAFERDGSHFDVLTEDGDTFKIGERSEEHTSELQSLMRNSSAVLGLKKKNK